MVFISTDCIGFGCLEFSSWISYICIRINIKFGIHFNRLYRLWNPGILEQEFPCLNLNKNEIWYSFQQINVCVNLGIFGSNTDITLTYLYPYCSIRFNNALIDFYKKYFCLVKYFPGIHVLFVRVAFNGTWTEKFPITKPIMEPTLWEPAATQELHGYRQKRK